MKKRISLSTKFVVGLVIIGIAICAVITAIGYTQYKSYIQKRYNDIAYDIAEVFEGYLSEEERAQYMDLAEGFFYGSVSEEELEAVKNSERYQEIESLLYHLREATEANDIYMCYSNKEEILSYTEETADTWSPSTYIFDCYMDEALKFELGHKGGFNAIYIDSVLEVLETGERVDNYFISESEFGYNTSAVYPVKIQGEVKGVIGVEIPMATLESALKEYITNSVLATVAVVVIFIALFILYTYRTMIAPINTIAREAELFVENNAEVSEKLQHIHTRDEIQQLSHSILQMEIGIKEYIANLTQVTAEKERIGAELDVAKQIQANMLPNIFPAFPEHDEFDIYATMEPAKEVGGDFYDLFMVDDTHLAIVMADVSGKGVPAALFMVIAKTLIKNHAQNKELPSQIFTNVNNQLCENNEVGMFVTGWLGIMDIFTGQMEYVNAGHNYPIVIRKDGSIEWIKSRPGFVLAGMENIRYRQNTLQLDEGDTIYLYTDGVTEALDVTQELFGDERLEKTLLQKQVKDMRPEALLHHIDKALKSFSKGAEQADDITMLALYRSVKRDENNEK